MYKSNDKLREVDGENEPENFSGKQVQKSNENQASFDKYIDRDEKLARIGKQVVPTVPINTSTLKRTTMLDLARHPESHEMRRCTFVVGGAYR